MAGVSLQNIFAMGIRNPAAFSKAVVSGRIAPQQMTVLEETLDQNGLADLAYLLRMVRGGQFTNTKDLETARTAIEALSKNARLFDDPKKVALALEKGLERQDSSNPFYDPVLGICFLPEPSMTEPSTTEPPVVAGAFAFAETSATSPSPARATPRDGYQMAAADTTGRAIRNAGGIWPDLSTIVDWFRGKIYLNKGPAPELLNEITDGDIRLLAQQAAHDNEAFALLTVLAGLSLPEGIAKVELMKLVRANPYRYLTEIDHWLISFIEHGGVSEQLAQFAARNNQTELTRNETLTLLYWADFAKAVAINVLKTLAFEKNGPALKKLFEIAQEGDYSILSNTIVALADTASAEPEFFGRILAEQPLVFCKEAWRRMPDLAGEYPQVYDLMIHLPLPDTDLEDFLARTDREIVAIEWGRKKIETIRGGNEERAEEATIALEEAVRRWGERTMDGDESYLFALQEAAAFNPLAAHELATGAGHSHNEALRSRATAMVKTIPLTLLIEKTAEGNPVATLALYQFASLGHPSAEKELQKLSAGGNRLATIKLFELDLFRHGRLLRFIPSHLIVRTNSASPDFREAFRIYQSHLLSDPSEEEETQFSRFIAHLNALGLRFEEDGTIDTSTIRTAQRNAAGDAHDFWVQHHDQYATDPVLKKIGALYDAVYDMMDPFPVSEGRGSN